MLERAVRPVFASKGRLKIILSGRNPRAKAGSPDRPYLRKLTGVSDAYRVDKPMGWRGTVVSPLRSLTRFARVWFPKIPGQGGEVLQSKMFLLAVAALVPCLVSAQNKTYTVRQGDTISEIATHLKVRSSELIAANALSNSHLVQPGMVLRIPARKPDSTPLAAPKGAKYYTVRNGDFDWSLARRHGLSLSQLKAMNPGVNFDNLQVGTRIALPKSGTTTTVVASAKPSGKDVRPAAKVAVRAHKVTEGEFDWVIAKHAGVTLSALRSANPGVDLNKLRIGQLLRVPVGSVPAAKADSSRVAALPAKRSISTTYAKVLGNGSTIRRSPGVGGEKVAAVDAGTQVKVLDHENGWYKLKFPKGTVGWMRGDLLKPVSVTSVAKARSKDRVAKATPTRKKSIVAPTSKAPTRTATRSRRSSSRPSLAIVDTTNSVIKTAYAQMGKRYIWGSTDRSNGGFDCSGLVNYAYRSNGVKLPRTSREMSTVGQRVSKDSMKPGDLIFFNTRRSSRINHVGMYVGNGKFIHSSSGQGGVRVDSINSGYYSRKMVTARRVVKTSSSSKPGAPKASE